MYLIDIKWVIMHLTSAESLILEWLYYDALNIWWHQAYANYNLQPQFKAVVKYLSLSLLYTFINPYTFHWYFFVENSFY